MKFTNGYWIIRPNFAMGYATQLVRVEKNADSLRLLASCSPVKGRGDTLGGLNSGGNLEVTLSSPRENIIRVKIVHFAGKKENFPHFATYEEKTCPIISEDENAVSFATGSLKAEIAKGSQWNIDFFGNGQLLTSSSYHGMAHGINRDTGKCYMSDSLMLAPGENVYGLGERFTAFVKNGQTVDMWNGDGGTCSEIAYKNIPFYMTNKKYGVFVEDTSDVSFEVASEKVERVQFSTEGESLTYDIIYGENQKEIISRYTALTGRPALPPAWSFGLWLSTSFTTDYDEETASSFIDGMLSRDIPLSVFHYDCFWMREYNWCDFEWDKSTFPDPAGMLHRNHEKGLHICCWINPYIGQSSPLFRDGMEKGYLLKKVNGDVWQSDMWQAGMGIVDVTNPGAREWYCAHLKHLMSMGIDCFKTDFGERIPVKDIAYYDGSDPVHMHNYYTFLYNQMVFDTVKEVRGEGEAMVFARSATAGCQQFPVHWGGDNSACYISMAETLRAGLSLSQSGFGYWSHDISGFEETASPDIYKRWVQFGLLSSHSRLHGSSSYRVPWLFDDESCLVVRKFAKLKCALMPYIFAAAVHNHSTGIPVVRPMVMEFPEDKACETLDMQYMMGNSLLIAPIFSETGEVSYYLPSGTWTNLLTGDIREGGRYWTEKFDYMSLPLMVRQGTVLPIGAVNSRTDYDYADRVALHVFHLADGESRTVSIPDCSGNVECTFTLTMEKGKAHVETDSSKPYTVVIHN